MSAAKAQQLLSYTRRRGRKGVDIKNIYICTTNRKIHIGIFRISSANFVGAENYCILLPLSWIRHDPLKQQGGSVQWEIIFFVQCAYHPPSSASKLLWSSPILLAVLFEWTACRGVHTVPSPCDWWPAADNEVVQCTSGAYDPPDGSCHPRRGGGQQEQGRSWTGQQVVVGSAFHNSYTSGGFTYHIVQIINSNVYFNFATYVLKVRFFIF